MLVVLHDLTGAPRIRLDVEVASSDAARERGLAGRRLVPTGTGMLFVFPLDVVTPFTVRPMLTSIDLIWIDANGVVLGVAKNLVPGDPRPVVPPMAYRSVLETTAGLLGAMGVTSGWTLRAG